MKYYWIDALSPLVFRSGKPFGTQADTHDIVFPLPSVAAGVIRTLSAQQKDDDFSGEFDVAQLKQITSNGIFLAQQDDSGSLKLFAPKPADSLYLKDKTDNNYNKTKANEKDKIRLIRLSPREMEEGCGCDLPHADLLPVQMPADMTDDELKGKPQSGKQFWLLEDWLKWQNGDELLYEQINQNGVNLPSPDARTHVAIDRDTQTGIDGLLFQTAAYDLANQRKEHHQGWEETRLGFVIATPETLKDDTVRFGGEGRLSRLEKVNLAENTFRKPEKLGNKIKLTLLTPAIFAQGWLPAWLDKNTLEGTLPHTQTRVKLRAVAMERWLPVSGWDLAERRPKAMRKAVPAGSVYWFDIDPNKNANDVANVANQSICDDEQDKRDGFGIVAVAPWKE